MSITRADLRDTQQRNWGHSEAQKTGSLIYLYAGGCYIWGLMDGKAEASLSGRCREKRMLICWYFEWAAGSDLAIDRSRYQAINLTHDVSATLSIF
jgi:hypothetical protein